MTTEWPTVPGLLARGLCLQPLPDPPQTIPGDEPAYCRPSGSYISEGYRLGDVTGGSTSDLLDAFLGNPLGWVSDDAARCLKAANPRLKSGVHNSLLIFAGSPAYRPMESRESARLQNRPCWSELVRDVWPARQGETMLMIVTADPKKRIWQKGEVGLLGNDTPVLHYDRGQSINGVHRIDWAELIDTLDIVERAYDLKFTKQQIRDGLLWATKTVAAVGWDVAAELERTLIMARQRGSFRLALTFAQRTEDDR